MFGYGKVRYRGLHKNAQRIALLLGFRQPADRRAESGGVTAAPVRPEGGRSAGNGEEKAGIWPFFGRLARKRSENRLRATSGGRLALCSDLP